MPKNNFVIPVESDFFNEDQEWLQLGPAKRLLETTKLWVVYRLMEGDIDPEPDTQSPFYFEKASG